jgi:hypothetical protein
MCPVCLATAAVIAGSTAGTGGLGALVARTLFNSKNGTDLPTQIEEMEVRDGIDNDSGKESEGSVAR